MAKTRRLKVIGSDDQYPEVRNLVRLAGRFLSQVEVLHREHVAMETEKLAQRLYGSQSAAIDWGVDQDPESAVHDYWDVQREGGQFWVVGTGG